MFLTRILIFAICLFVVFQTARAEESAVKTQIFVTTAHSVIVTGKTANPKKIWRFVDAAANAQNLTNRIEKFELFDEAGRAVRYARNQAGEFVGETSASRWRSEIKLDFPKNPASAAHISWLADNNGVLMLDDLLPEFIAENGQVATVEIEFAVPENWKIQSSELQINEKTFVAADYQKAVFMLGELQQTNVNVGKTAVTFARTADAWSFGEAEAAQIIDQIFSEYQQIFGSLPTAKAQILLAPLPQNFAGESWAAETRGSTVFIVSAVSNFKSRAVAKLHEQLRHEIFHLWIPNGLNLIGDYAWFYEGFAIYQALKTGVKLKFIRFEDFLDTLSRAFDAARASEQNKNLNLLEASRLRFVVDNGEFVYAKGMIVAFLCDVVLLDKSNGKKSVTDVLKQIFERHRKPARAQPANAAVLTVLKSKPETAEVIQTFVETAGALEWQNFLQIAGLQNLARTNLTRLAVPEKLSGRQRKVLAKLGYSPIQN